MEFELLFGRFHELFLKFLYFKHELFFLLDMNVFCKWKRELRVKLVELFQMTKFIRSDQYLWLDFLVIKRVAMKQDQLFSSFKGLHIDAKVYEHNYLIRYSSILMFLIYSPSAWIKSSKL